MTKTKTNIVVTNYKNSPGVYTMGDFKRFLVNNNYDVQSYLDEPIRNFANFDAVQINSSSSYSEAKKIFEKHRIDHLVVVEGKLAVGGLDKKCLHE
jgi:CBS domain-containing protein